MPFSKTYDVIVIGAGHNGLVTAAYLAAAGHQVAVFEKNAVVGGAALTEEFHPGFRNSVASYTVSLLNPRVMADLELKRHGLVVIERPAGNFWPIDDQRYLLLRHGIREKQEAIRAFSEKDAARYLAYDQALGRAASFLRGLVGKTPPNGGGGWLEILRNGAFGKELVSLSVDDKRLLSDLFTKSVETFLEQWFENDIVKGALAFDGIVGSYAAPSTPGTAYVLLHHCFGEVNGKLGMWGHAIGGMGAITQAMAKAARARGVTIHTSTSVTSLCIENGRVAGVVLGTGETVRSRTVAANIAPKLLFSKLVPEHAVVPEIRQRFMSITSGSGSFRMNVALSELPDFTCRPGRSGQEHHGAGIIIGPSMRYLEMAFHEAQLDGWSKNPIIEMLIPSVLDDTLAPKGLHVASLFVQHVAPHLPGERSWQNAHEKETFADLVIDTVGRYAPNFKSAVLARQVLSPLDLEHRFGLVDGDIFHGQLSLGQLFSLRPVFGYANYRMPLAGLYLCGSGAHPGGGVTGVPGMNAAREMIRDLRNRSVRH